MHLYHTIALTDMVYLNHIGKYTDVLVIYFILALLVEKAVKYLQNNPIKWKN